MMNKKLVALLISIAVMLTAFGASGYAARKPTSVLLDGTPVQMSDGQPFVDQGTTFVPMRPLFKLLDIQVSWNGKQQTVSGVKGDLSIALTIGSKTAAVNGHAVQLSAAPRIVRSVTYVPLRFVGEATGYKVGWTASTNTITLTSPPQRAASKGFLWKTQHNGNTVYLLGSIHVASDAMYPLRPEIEQALAAADYLGVELDITDIDQAYIQNLLMTDGIYNDGTTLKDHISDTTYKKLAAAFQSRGLPANSADAYKPWVVTQSLPTWLSSPTDYTADLGIDMYLLQKAKSSGKPIISLESTELQMNMFIGFSDSVQEALLLETINTYSQSVVTNRNAGQDALAKMWSEGDEQTLVSLTTGVAASPEYYKGLIADRNAGMTEKVEGYLNGEGKKTYLIVVGALHMLGPDGVVTQLEKDGFAVEKL